MAGSNVVSHQTTNPIDGHIQHQTQQTVKSMQLRSFLKGPVPLVRTSAYRRVKISRRHRSLARKILMDPHKPYLYYFTSSHTETVHYLAQVDPPCSMHSFVNGEGMPEIEDDTDLF